MDRRRLYLVVAEYRLLVVAETLAEAEAEAGALVGDAGSLGPPDAVAGAEIRRLTDIPDSWRDIAPIGPDYADSGGPYEEVSCREVLARIRLQRRDPSVEIIPRREDD